MRLRPNIIAACACFALACFLGGSVAGAQTINISVSNIALKNGESMEFGNVYLISTDCRSLLTGTPEVEVMEGPPGVTVAIQQAMVVPRGHSCARPVSGGKMIITAKDIEDYSNSSMTLRIKYKNSRRRSAAKPAHQRHAFPVRAHGWWSAARLVFGFEPSWKTSVRTWLVVSLAALPFGIVDAVMGAKGHAQNISRLALKAGESAEVMPVYWVLNCRSTMVGLPEIEILEGPSQITLSIKPGMVLPRSQGCANRVSGGILMATVKDVTEPMETKITFRLKYKTKDGDRPRGYVYRLSLFP